MIDFHTWATPNGYKVHIMLEECGAAYRLHPVNIRDEAALSAQVLPLNVNRKIPVIVDDEGPGGESITVSESGAILFYLAEKTGRFLSSHPVQRHAAMQWLMFQMSAVGPMMGQLNHFTTRDDVGDAYARARFGTEVSRIHAVMERHLGDHAFFAGAEYSIADMAIFPWLRLSEKLGVQWSGLPRLRAWFDQIAERPAVQRALESGSTLTTVRT